MLVISGISFGQKEGKAVWETSFDGYINAYEPFDLYSGVNGTFMVKRRNNINSRISTFSDIGLKTFDNSGKILLKSNDLYKNRSQGGGVSTVNYFNDYSLVYGNKSIFLNQVDTIFLLNKDFQVIKGFSKNDAGNYPTSVEDGFIYHYPKYIAKHDINGKEEWRYNSENPIFISTQKAPYICVEYISSTSKNIFFTLDKNGKKKASVDPQIPGTVFPTDDKGFWLFNNDDEYIKFDSTGKKTAEYLELKLLKNQFFTHRTILPDNSIMIDLIKDNGIFLTKISPSGVVKEYFIPSIIKFKDFFSTFISKVVAPENKIMYSLRLPDTEQAEADIKYKIGVVDFDNLANSWSKDVSGGASNGTYGNTFTFEAGNTFFQVFPSPVSPPDKFFKVYDIKGNLTWESPFYVPSARTETNKWKIIGDYLYVATKVYQSSDGILIGSGSGNKIKFANGKDVWGRKDISFSNGNILNDVQIDKNGNDVILYSKYVGFVGLGGFWTYRIETLNPDGSGKWYYTFEKSNNYSYQYIANTYFTSTEDGKLALLTQEIIENQTKLTLRKVSPCNDMNAISILGNTEACPTEKVRLSIPKQEGITYQWQKDGKDVPNVKDVVYDFGESGTYTVVAKDELCQNMVTSNALKVNIRSLPTAEITAPKSIFCDGEKVTIASKTNGIFFQWQKDGKDILNATMDILEVSQAGDYRIGVRGDKCPQVGYSNIYTIITKLLPEAKISTDMKGVVYEPFTVKMSANSGTGLAYQWLKDDVIIPNETKLIYEAKKSGKYNVIVTQEGCEKRSDALTISILIPLSNQEEVGEEEVKVYPNPSKGEFKIILPKSLKSANIQLFDTFGREWPFTDMGEQIRADGLTQGIYFLRVQKGGKAVINKIVIE